MLERGFEFAPGYRLQEFLGRGQFGQVWRASAPGGTAAAVKFIDLTEGSGQKEYAGIKRVKQIRQANLMPITAIWLLDKHGKVIDEPPEDATETMDVSAVGASQAGMVVMPQEEPAWLVVSMLLGGQSLLHRLRECVKEGLSGIPPKELLSYMDESAKGLDFLNEPRHDLGEGPVAIQHCDVKPANIVMIGTSAVVCDFGLARILSRNQITATSASGTPAYMAPEAISGKPSRTSDQYSLAVTYYHLRTGSLPIKDGTLFEVLDAHRQGKLDFGGIGEAEQAVLRKATEIEWENRFESNADFVDALREALRSEGFTKPRFTVPTSGTAETLDSPQDKVDTVDPIATMDTGYATSRSDHVKPLDAAATPKSELTAARGPIWSQPKVLVPLAVCLLAIGGFAFLGPGDTKGNGDTNGKNGGPASVDPPPELSVQEFLAEAERQFETDESKATELYATALGKDPSLSRTTMYAIGKHSSAVESLLQTPDGSRLVTIGYDKTPFLWDISDLVLGAKQYKLQPGEASIYPDAVALSPDGTQLVCGLAAEPFVWTLKDGETPATRLSLPKHEHDVLAVAWHPTDKPFVVTASESGISVIQLGPPTVDSPHGSVAKSKLFPSAAVARSLRFDPSGSFLVLVSEQGEMKAFRWTDLVQRLDEDSAPDPFTVNAPGTRVVCIDFVQSPEDEYQVVAGSLDGSITLWQLGQVQQKDRYAAHDGSSVEAISVAHTTAGDVIAGGGGDGSISVWPIVNPTARSTFKIGSEPVADVDISADGRWIAAAGNDGTVWLWDHRSGKAARIHAGLDTVDRIKIDSAGRWLFAGCGDGTVRAWGLVRCKLLVLSTTIVDVKSKTKQPPLQTQASL